MRRSLWATLGTIALAMFGAAPTPGAPAPPRLTKAEYIAFTDGYAALQSSLLAVLQGVQTARDMRADVAMVIIGTPHRLPRGECGMALSRYRQLLIAYARAVDRGSTYGPPTALTLSHVERRASVICRPSA